jgi:hypothetical protein
MAKFTKDLIERAVKAKNYVWFEDTVNKGLDLNIVGIRNDEPGQKVTNLFDDWITVSYKENGVWRYHEWEATTDPGRRGVQQFGNPNGVARLVPGQYRSSHILGLHQGKYQALRQNKPVKVYRDKNKDLIFDEHTIQEGLFGINIHKAGDNSTFVENWSEGCQVFKKAIDFTRFMDLCKRAAGIHGISFTYTLLNSNDLQFKSQVDTVPVNLPTEVPKSKTTSTKTKK